MPAGPNAILVPMDVPYQGAWLTWVAATTTCLKALGHDVDCVDVAGMSGYAFILSVHKELCPSGPTVFDWHSLLAGVQLLGRTTLCFTSGDCHTADHRTDATRAHCRAAYDLVAREIEAGRPCVLWGAYVPEFAAVIGVEDGAYHVKSYRTFTGETEPPIPFDEVNAPGGPYALGFPTTVDIPQEMADQRAVAHAAQLLNQPRYWADYGYGPAAYDTWIAALEANVANPFGNAYNTVCWTEGRRFAHEFLRRVAARNPNLSGIVGEAADAYGEASKAMHAVEALFPFPQGGDMANADVRAAAIEELRKAKAAEARAAEALARAALA